MRYLHRHLEDRLERYAARFKIVLVAGARQVGKSTLLEHVFPQVKSVVLDPVQDIYGARSDPDRFLDTFGTPLLLDEVQYAPELLPALKRRVDRSDLKGQYFLTGSQNLAVMRNVSESLAGRVGILRLDGMTPAEMCGAAQQPSWIADFVGEPDTFQSRVAKIMTLDGLPSLAEYLWRGQLPGLTEFDLEDVPAYLSAYVQTYIERDVRIMGNIRDLAQFGCFLRLCAALTGQEIIQSQLGREFGISPKTARHWLDMLCHSYQWLELPAYSGNTIKRLTSKPKGHLQDTGLACYLHAISSPQSLLASPLFGHLFESWCVSWIHHQIQRLPLSPSLTHWRTQNGAEIDIVLECDGRLLPIECKASTRLSKHDARGIHAFRNTYRQAAPGVILYGGDVPWVLSEDAVAIPWSAA